MLKPESISFIEVQAPRNISGNKKYQLNPDAYLPQGIIPLDLTHSFEEMPRMLQLPEKRLKQWKRSHMKYYQTTCLPVAWKWKHS